MDKPTTEITAYAQAALNSVLDRSSAIHIAATTKPYSALNGGHLHLNSELFIQIRGRCRFDFHDSRCELDPGQALLIPPGTAHYETPLSADGSLVGGDDAADWHNLVCILGHERLQIHQGALSKSYRPKMRLVTHFHADMAQRCMQWAQDFIAIQRQGLSNIAGHIWRCLINGLLHLAEQGGDSVRTTQRQRVGMCKALIERKLGNHSLSVQELAQELDCTADYLSRQFHQETGEKLNAYINRQRLSMAADLLIQHPNLGIATIARSVGFNDPSYFARQFVRNYQEKPSIYRQRNVSND